MVDDELRTKKITIKDKEIEIHELTVQNQIDLDASENKNLGSFYSLCMSEEDWQFVKDLPARSFNKIADVVAELNKREEGDVKDFPEPVETKQ